VSTVPSSIPKSYLTCRVIFAPFDSWKDGFRALRGSHEEGEDHCGAGDQDPPGGRIHLRELSPSDFVCPCNGGADHAFRDSTSLIAAFSSARSAYMRLSFEFSASSSFIRFNSLIVTLPHFDGQLKQVARLIPCLRASSAGATPAYPPFKIATICDSVNLDCFVSSPVLRGRVRHYTVRRAGSLR